MLCTTKNNTGKNLSQDCTRRSLCYEIWCRKCEKDGEREIEREEKDEKEKEILKKELKLHKYIGETSRSIFERSLEHSMAWRHLNSNSHMLKHCIDKHEENEENENKAEKEEMF